MACRGNGSACWVGPVRHAGFRPLHSRNRLRGDQRRFPGRQAGVTYNGNAGLCLFRQFFRRSNVVDQFAVVDSLYERQRVTLANHLIVIAGVGKRKGSFTKAGACRA